MSKSPWRRERHNGVDYWVNDKTPRGQVWIQECTVPRCRAKMWLLTESQYHVWVNTGSAPGCVGVVFPRES